jgi:FKBP-type peptidyl-prolyl cis-trans isomerase
MSREEDLQVIFAELTTGDSVTFDVSVQQFFDNTVQAPVPPELNATDMLQFNVGLDNVMNRDEVMAWNEERMAKQRAMIEAEMEKQFDIDIEKIENHLSENGITTQKTESGVYYEILEDGTGEQPANGNTVRVAYTGRLLTGELFDSSYEEVARENNTYTEGRTYEPYEFILGQGTVIKGWDEGLTYLKEGTKARFYIPSTLAYGPQQRPPVIGPNSILVFDIELVEVK